MEAYVSVIATPITDACAIKAIELVSEYLRPAVANGENLEARDKMAYADYLAGMAFNNASLGYVLEELARLGIGRIVAIDPDIFVEHNLNRQLLSSPDNLGEAKVDAASERIALINPAVSVTSAQEACGEDNAVDLLQAADVVVDLRLGDSREV